MSDTEPDSQNTPADGEGFKLAAERPTAPPRTDMTVAEMREWLRNWVANATGQSADAIDDATPMVELGLSSRDAVAMASDIEDLTGVTLTATVAFRHPTIESLATVIVEGEPEFDDTADEFDWSRDVDKDDIAIVGLATRFPGDMNTPDETWRALLEGRDGITDLPEGRWEEFLEEPRIAERVAKARTRGGYLKDIKGFDAEFFALSKMEADNIDPQQRMALELTWEALEHARIPASALRGESVAVYIGSSTNDYQFLAMSDPSVAHPYAITGTATSIIANRVSYFFDFRGPSVSVDTACSSSLVAAHHGVQALRAREADVALVGGVNALITPLVTVGFDEVGGVLAPDGHIKSFSQDADGYARSEGGGMLVLKRVADARRDGDEILAVIAGSAVNHDGRSNGLLAPNPDAQAEVLRKAYKDAGIDPRTVDYIEAHGTGTILGDPIEADALGRVVGRGRAPDKPALLGAVKSNVGHLESAAGAASLAKMTLALKNDKLPPSINYTGPNPYIDFDAVHLKVADTVTDWPRYSGHAISGVSGFGFGGANAHLVLREVLPSDLVEPEPEPEPVAEKSTSGASAAEDTAVYVGGVRMDEYGEFIHDDENEGSEFFGQHAYDTDEREPEMPGLTDEAKRLKEVALQELEAEDAAHSRCAAGCFGVPDVPQEGGGRRARRLDRQPRRPRFLAGVDRPLAVAAQPRQVPRCGDGARPRRGGQGTARSCRRQAEPERVQRRRPRHQRAGMGAGRFRCPAPQDGQEPVSARRDVRRVDRQGRRTGPGRARVLRRRADPRRRAGLRHRDHSGHHLRDSDRAR